MIYAMSDLHGCYKLYKKMLEKINFSENDTLYILGDVVDRGDEPISILLDMKSRKNIIPIMGNHESRMLEMLPSYGNLDNNDLLQLFFNNEDVQIWLKDGGLATILQYRQLSESQKLELIDYVKNFNLAKSLEINGKQFFLSHSIPSKERLFSTQILTDIDILWGEPDFHEVYKEDIIFVYGHTPTEIIDPIYSKKIYKKNNHIDLDCGAFFLGQLGCICLDTMEEFYVEKD